MAEIKVYSTPMCPYCHKVKDFLKDNNVEFEAIDVSQDQGAAKYMVEKTNQMGVPVIEIDDEFIVGFNKAKIVEKLGL